MAHQVRKITKSTHAQVARAAQIGSAEYDAKLEKHEKAKRLVEAIEELDEAAPVALSGELQSLVKAALVAHSLDCLF